MILEGDATSAELQPCLTLYFGQGSIIDDNHISTNHIAIDLGISAIDEALIQYCLGDLTTAFR